MFIGQIASERVVGNLEVGRSRPEMLLRVRNWRSVGPASKVVVELLRLNLAPVPSRPSSAHPRPKLCGAQLDVTTRLYALPGASAT